jgi:hypothetical protein
LEVIDINNTGSTVTLNNDDILSIVGDEAANDLRVNGTVGDTLDLNSNGFGATGSTEVIDLVTYDIYSNAALDTSVRLLVQQGIDVTGAPDTSIVVFDLVNGVSSDHSSRTFDVNVNYTIYVVVDAASHVLNTVPGAGTATWGKWKGAGDLGADDNVTLVTGDESTLLGMRGNAWQSVSTDFVSWWVAVEGGFSGAKVGMYGQFYRNDGYGVGSTDLWDGMAGTIRREVLTQLITYIHTGWVMISTYYGPSVGSFAPVGAYGPAIAAGVLTSQGLV